MSRLSRCKKSSRFFLIKRSGFYYGGFKRIITDVADGNPHASAKIRLHPSLKRGFLLFEVLLSVTILSVGLALVLRSIGTSLDAMQISEDYMHGTLALEEALIGLQLKGGIEKGETEKNILTDFGEFGYKIDAKELKNTDLNEVNFSISWKSGKRPQRIDILTYIKDQK